MYSLFKRLSDIVAASLLLVLSSPLWLISIVLLLFLNKGKVFFFQERPGRMARIFKVVKFKTMTDKKDENGQLLPDNQRITKVGGWIRSSSIDELPQLVNVVKGDMSLVGPRPLLTQYLPLYNERQSRRHEVRPGITGWAQVNGRNTLSWEEKFEYDVYYVDHMSFALDMKILFSTFVRVIKKDGINVDASTTMRPFTGNKGS